MSTGLRSHPQAVRSLPEQPAPELIRQLCHELNRSQIAYCHWKSNAAISRSASGENDLDLLVSRQDVERFTQILVNLGFKQANDHPWTQMPGVLNFYGYLCETGRLVHVHAHYQLIFGHDATKNYHLPVEKPYLASAWQDGLFKVPSPEFELILLVIRLMLKHSTWDTLLMRQGKFSASEKSELNYLLQRADPAAVEELIKAHLPGLPSALFADCLEVLKSGGGAVWRARVGARLLRVLEPYARRPQPVDTFLKLWRRVWWPFQARLFGKRDSKQMRSGGLLIAIVGGDGAGKTTVVNALQDWLSEEFEVYRFHMGKPNWSLISVLVHAILKIGRSLGLYPYMRAEIQFTRDPDQIVFPGYPWMFREACTARDRYLLYRKARRLATNGALVILDRFPLAHIQFMDGPQIDWLTGNLPPNRVIRTLGRLEKQYYQKMMLPDALIILLADPEVAVRRKTDETPESVRARSTEIWQSDWSRTPAHVIDANRSKEEVLSDVKRLLWSLL